uniref:Uncharacterized protein n=1 Tax=Romanomermis culicivorax TaxID=13658 RepID=A0A915L3J6_ROMCU
MSDSRNDVAGLLKNCKVAGNLSSVRNWMPKRAYIPTQSSAPSKETTMVCLPWTRENNAVQSSGVAAKVSKMNMVPLGNSGWKIRLLRAEERNKNKMVKE